MTKFLAESRNYKITSESETTYLHLKYEKEREIEIGHFYGDPTCAIISRDELYAVVGGMGLIIYQLIEPFRKYVYNSKNTSQYSQFFREKPFVREIDTLYQHPLEECKFFRFVAYENDKETIFRMNAETFEIEII